jgi:hypothetical protein
MLRGGAPGVGVAVGSTGLGATLRRTGGGGGPAEGRGIEIGPVLPLGLGGAATGRGGTAELPELPLFDPSFSDIEPLALRQKLVLPR